MMKVENKRINDRAEIIESIGFRLRFDLFRQFPNRFCHFASGNTRTARTGSFGYFRFDEVEVGQTYVVEIRSKRFQFNPQIISVSEEISNLEFVAVAQK